MSQETPYPTAAPGETRLANPKELIKQLLENPDLVNQLTDEELKMVQQHINPYGDIPAADESFANLSLINYRDEYHRKYLITGLVGYMYRLAFEYRPAEVDDIETRYEREIGKTKDNAERKRLIAEKDAFIDDYVKSSRRVVEKFLNKNFQYNPDRHVRAAHTDNPNDPERIPKDELIRRRCAVAKRARRVESVMRSDADRTFAATKNLSMITYQQTLESVNAIDAALKAIGMQQAAGGAAATAVGSGAGGARSTNSANGGAAATTAGSSAGGAIDDALVILNRAKQKLVGIQRELARVVEPISAEDTLACVRVNPPADVFYHFGRYLTNHHEHIRDTVAALYSEKPDFEYAVIYYGSFGSEEEAREYRIKHEAEFRAATFTVSNRGITLLGPFKQNRERVDFYNKHTDILKQMMEQMELDHKLGKDLMEKAVKREKIKNIAQVGPDQKGLKDYVKVQHEINQFTAKKVLSEQDERELEKLVRQREQLEVPPDMIQMDVFKTVEDIETGEAQLKRDIYYTQAESPLHMEENSQYADSYQPNLVKPKYRLARARAMEKAKANEERLQKRTAKNPPPPKRD
jgi:hypothetical protein